MAARQFGAAACHIEDQVGAKRCGHRPGKELVSQEEMVDRVKAAVDARNDPSFVVMARTDALAVEGLQAAIDRAGRCVEAGACPILEDNDLAAANRPVVKVSWRDAQAYAAWLSRETGEHYRLPTDEEWAYAAASRFKDDALPETDDPGQRALGLYTRDRGDGDVDREPQPIGTFGANENGLVDVAGNVWEWTDTCFTRSALDGHGETVASTVHCGVRVVEGRHRAYMTDFVRDARSGGCSAGVPPTNLGFRLVRDDDSSWRPLSRLMVQAQRLATR